MRLKPAIMMAPSPTSSFRTMRSTDSSKLFHGGRGVSHRHRISNARRGLRDYASELASTTTAMPIAVSVRLKPATITAPSFNNSSRAMPSTF